MFKSIGFHTDVRQTLVNLTNEVKGFVQETNVQEGICLVYCGHSTAGLVINSYLDPKTPEDIVYELDRIVPTRVDFAHQFDTPSDASAHVKATLTGTHVSVIIHEGKLLLGRSQGILFAEFDGPRDRTIQVKVLAG